MYKYKETGEHVFGGVLQRPGSCPKYKYKCKCKYKPQVEFYRGQEVTPGDRYLVVMREFMAMASVRLAELEDLFTDMKARFGFEKKKKIKEELA